MLEIIRSGGWLMLPLILGSLVATAIIAERFWALRRLRLTPPGLVEKMYQQWQQGKLDVPTLQRYSLDSALGRVLASGLAAAADGREAMKESIQQAGDHVVHDLQRYLSTLGTIAAISPMIGLLGTVVAMMDIFNVIMAHGSGNTGLLAGGIAKALITTAAGLIVAIPALYFHRFLNRRIEEIVVVMEQQAQYLVNLVSGQQSAAKKNRS